MVVLLLMIVMFVMVIIHHVLVVMVLLIVVQFLMHVEPVMLIHLMIVLKTVQVNGAAQQLKMNVAYVMAQVLLREHVIVLETCLIHIMIAQVIV